MALCTAEHGVVLSRLECLGVVKIGNMSIQQMSAPELPSSRCMNWIVGTRLSTKSYLRLGLRMMMVSKRFEWTQQEWDKGGGIRRIVRRIVQTDHCMGPQAASEIDGSLTIGHIGSEDFSVLIIAQFIPATW